MPYDSKTADIILAINQVTDPEYLRAINRACIDRMREAQRIKLQGLQASGALRVGARVSFESRKTRTRVTGVVEKINQKTVMVKSPTGLWKVAPSLLKVESDPQPSAVTA